MYIKSVVAVALFTSFTAAQTSSNSTIVPNSVPLSTRAGWCNGQYSTCGYLCSGDAKTNDCSPETLQFSCICTANNSAPGLQYYKQSLPTFICQEIYEACIRNTENNKAGQDLCTKNRDANCGTLSPENFTASVSTTSSSGPAPTASRSGTAAPAGATTSTSRAAAPTLAVREIGTGLFAVGVAAFGMVL